jgi:hypothetical protein
MKSMWSWLSTTSTSSTSPTSSMLPSVVAAAKLLLCMVAVVGIVEVVGADISSSRMSGSGHVHMESMLHRDDFERLHRSSPTLLHEVVIAIHQRNLDVLEEMVLDRSTPGSPRYQQWMTFTEVGNLIANDEAVAEVESWLERQPDTTITWKSKRGEYIRAMAPISVWEETFQTRFYEWKDTNTFRQNFFDLTKSGSATEAEVEASHSKGTLKKGFKGTYHRAEHYSLPSELLPHIDAVFNTVQPPPVISSAAKRVRGDTTSFATSLSWDKVTQGLRGIVDGHVEGGIEADRGGVGIQSASTVTVATLNSLYQVSSNTGSLCWLLLMY